MLNGSEYHITLKQTRPRLWVLSSHLCRHVDVCNGVVDHDHGLRRFHGDPLQLFGDADAVDRGQGLIFLVFIKIEHSLQIFSP